VSEAIRRSRLDRSEIFVETKVWITDYGYDETLQAFDKSAGKLGMEQIDPLILHQPLPGEFDLTLDASCRQLVLAALAAGLPGAIPEVRVDGAVPGGGKVGA
jgi:diketogulonate reductase-like aldo/keto reductase